MSIFGLLPLNFAKLLSCQLHAKLAKTKPAESPSPAPRNWAMSYCFFKISIQMLKMTDIMAIVVIIGAIIVIIGLLAAVTWFNMGAIINIWHA